MDMYVRMMNELKRSPDDNPTVGIILCTQKDASIVRYSALHENEQVFGAGTSLCFLPKRNFAPSLNESEIS